MKINKQKLSYFATGFVLIALLTTIGSYFYTKHVENKGKSYMDIGLIAYREGNYLKAVKNFEKALNPDTPEAAFSLGAMYFAGKGVVANTGFALSLYEAAANEDYAPAQTTLAVLYAEGKVVEKSIEKALQYAETAAKNNDLDALLMLARWYDNGEYVDQDVKKAVSYYTKAAYMGNLGAKSALEVLYQKGKQNLPPNLYTAVRWEQSSKKQIETEKLLSGKSARKKSRRR